MKLKDPAITIILHSDGAIFFHTLSLDLVSTWADGGNGKAFVPELPPGQPVCR